MSSTSENPLQPTAPENFPVSRRAFVAGSAALVGGLLLPREAGAQSKMAAHDFGLRSAPVAARAPLAASPFVALPLGSVKAQGWLLRQLELQRDGLTGHAEEVLPATAPNSAWKGGDGEDWEKGPYYLKGLIALAYTLDDAALKAKVTAWVEPILTSARPDGFFGPKKNDDWWPRMVATYLLRDYAEASGDKRVEPFLTGYYRYMAANMPARKLSSWGRARAGDEIETVFWLYNRTGDAFLLPLADLLAEQALPWKRIFNDNSFLETEDSFMANHAVNVPQALKMPAVYSQRSGNAEDKAAYRAGITHLMRDHGTSFGINTGTERLSGRSSVEGTELCSIVEHMLSAETAMRILGDARIGDDLELIAFNALPAALSKDIRQHVYYTVSNNVLATKGEVGYEQDHGNDRVMAPISGYPCCCYNFHMGWPKLAQNAWAATSDGGLAVMAYVPSQVSAPIAGGSVATVVCDTHYPFEDTVRLTVGLEKAARFPLQLRIPGWCRNPQIKINGKAGAKAAAGSFAVLNRQWKNGDVVELTFPMTVETVQGINGSVSIRRGPLVYALPLEESWNVVERNKVPGFDSYEITSNSPWNYALVTQGAGAFQFVNRPGAENPFETGRTPVALRVQGKRVEEWTMRFDGHLPLEPPLSPVASHAASQTLELVPFGSQMLRISEFPVVGTPAAAPKTWSEEFTPDYANRWVVQRGGMLHDGELHLPQGAKALAAAAVFSDCTYDADVTVGEHGDAGVILRGSQSSVGTDHYLGYYVGINAEANLVIFGKSNNTWLPSARQSLELQPGRHHIRVEARGPQFRIWVDNMETPILEVRDETFTSGALGVRSYSDAASFGKLSAVAI